MKGRNPGPIQDRGLGEKLGGGKAWSDRDARLRCDVGSGGALRCASRGVGWAARQSQRCKFGRQPHISVKLAELVREVCRQEYLSSLEREVVKTQKRPISVVADHSGFKSERLAEAQGSGTSSAGREGTEMEPELEGTWS